MHETASARGVRRTVRRAWIGVAGVTTIAAGVVLIPLPGPGSLVILGGLTILGREYPRAARAAASTKRTARRVVMNARGRLASAQLTRGEDRPER